MKIARCYDSHTHFQATGMMQSGLTLFHLKNPNDVKDLKVQPWHFRGEWLTGFGWDENKWPDKQLPTARELDQVFSQFPVAFVRADGHGVWLNSKALEKVGLTNPMQQIPGVDDRQIVRGQDGRPTGVLKDLAKIHVDGFIPPYQRSQEIQFLSSAQRYFNQRGFTHVRDMTGFLSQWDLLNQMDQRKELTVYLEENFTCENISDFDRALTELNAAKRSETPHLKAIGIKFYFDGSLGSETALLSRGYGGHHDQKGLTLWPIEHVQEVIERTWDQKFQVSAHTLGDEASHLIALAALKVQEKGKSGVINFEHVEILRPETIAIMTQLNVRAHMQPCHWHSDRRWLKEKLGPLYENAFPWAALESANVSMSFGSDSPIEEASIVSNEKALFLSVGEGIPSLSKPWQAYHQHPDMTWGENCWSEIDNGKVSKVFFDGKALDLTTAP